MAAGPHGLVVHHRAVRCDVYGAIPNGLAMGMPFENRLATTTTVFDGEIDNQTGTIEVTADALSGSALRRITALSDTGSEGVVSKGAVSAPYFITTQRGCCRACGDSSWRRTRSTRTSLALGRAAC